MFKLCTCLCFRHHANIVRWNVSRLHGLVYRGLLTACALDSISLASGDDPNAYGIQWGWLVRTDAGEGLWKSHTGARLLLNVYTAGSSRCPVFLSSIFLSSSDFFKFCLSTWTLIGIASECIPESMNAYIIRTAFLLLTRSHKLILNHFNIWNSHTGQRLVPHVYTSGSSRCPVVSKSISLGSSYFLRIRLSTWTLEGIVSECLPETKNAHIIRIPCFLMTYSHKVNLIHI